jgi:hypothetical protein
MPPVTIPLLYCPFSPAINPLAEEAARHTDAWVSAFDLHTGAAYSRYRENNFARLTARFYPGAGAEQLKIANDFIVLLFALDDLLDYQHERLPLIQKQEHLHTFIDHFTAVIHHRPVAISKAEAPVLAAWADLWPRIVSISPDNRANGFAHHMTALLEAALWESGNMRTRLPTVAQYMEKRPYLAGAHISTGIIPVIEDISLPDEVLQHPVVAELEQLSRSLVCWSNDLFSFGKEQEHGDDHNLVNLLQHERRLSQEEAVLCAAAIHNTDMRRFVTLSGRLPVYDETTNRALARYVEALRRHIRGNVDWSEKDSGRYSFVYGRS